MSTADAISLIAERLRKAATKDERRELGEWLEILGRQIRRGKFTE